MQFFGCSLDGPDIEGVKRGHEHLAAVRGKHGGGQATRVSQRSQPLAGRRVPDFSGIFFRHQYELARQTQTGAMRIRLPDTSRSRPMRNPIPFGAPGTGQGCAPFHLTAHAVKFRPKTL